MKCFDYTNGYYQQSLTLTLTLPQLVWRTEIWQKGKSLNRERAVLACFLAHLIAMKKSFQLDYDIILEDNVRIFDKNPEEFIRLFIDDKKTNNNNTGVRYFGYLGPSDNLNWFYKYHLPKYPSSSTSVPFPFNPHYSATLNEITREPPMSGTSLWGAYAYSISSAAHANLITVLQNDVGALMWRGKRMKTYRIKPVDKVLPRRTSEAGLSVECIKRPVFFRAPMLGVSER